MEYEVLYSGSTGNCTILTFDNFKVMIDIGRPFSHIKDYLHDVDVLLITHKHIDHLNLSAYKGIRMNHPNIYVAGNNGTNIHLVSKKAQQLDLVFDNTQPIYIDNVAIYPIENYHDVDCQGFIINEHNKWHLYATDLSTTIDYQEFLDKRYIKLDTLLLEANYNPDVIEFIEYKKLHTGFDTFSNGSQRHLPVQDWQYMKEHYTKPNAKFEELHISQTYHDFEGCLKKFDFTMEDVNAWKTN